MAWFAVPVVFSIPAPTEEAAALLADDQHVSELQELLDYPDASVAVLGEDADEDDDGGLGRYRVAVSVVLGAGGARTARSVVERAVADLETVRNEYRAVRDAASVSDPRSLSEETKRAIEWAKDVLGDRLREDAGGLRSGAKFEELLWLHLYLPGCFAVHYDADFVERFIEAVERGASKLANYPETYLATTVEELAGHALIDEAVSVLDVRSDDQSTTEPDDDRFTKHRAVVARGELDDLREDAFEDHDILMLFEPRFDGIEASEIAEKMGFSNLHVSDWFTRSAPTGSDRAGRQEFGSKSGRVRPLTDIEASQVLAASARRPSLQRFALRLLVEYRLTAQEICRLTLDRVDGPTLTVDDKRGELREVELHGAALHELEEQLRNHPGGLLLTGPTGPLRPDALRRLLRSASAAAGIEEEISIHRSARVADVRA